ncbi:hypothetical protein PUN28_013540 [Cardiocondyla obscurior]
MYFDALADMLDGMEPPDHLKKKISDKLYVQIKKFSQLVEQQNLHSTQRKVIQSAIDFLSRHINLFENLLYTDYKFWHKILRKLSLETTNCGDKGRHALKKFYQIIGHILMTKNSENEKILTDFMENFLQEFGNTNLDLITLRLMIYGFSQMAAPCRVHMTKLDVGQMYSITTSYALPLCISENSNSEQIENVCYYLEALSKILCHMLDVTTGNINVLIKLGIYIIKRYPDFASERAISALTTTFNNLTTIDNSLLQRYLDSIIYDGIAWSCSHTLALDVELQEEQNREESPVCYKNYLSLWTELLNPDKYRVEGHEQLAQYVANTITDVCITLINRLNIEVKQKNEDTVLSNVAFTQSAENQTDFRVFINLVDLYVDVIDASELQLFASTVHRFLCETIQLSYKYPLISGFYKLIQTGMKIFIHVSRKEEENSAESQRTKELLSNYLWHILDLISTFSNELLIACLYMILNAPLVYFQETILRTLPMFKIAFTIGLSNLELAYNALIALETWTTPAQKQSRDDQTNELLREIIVYLEPYLRSTESSIEISNDAECTLRNFQRRVLLFLGSFDHDLLTSFVHERASRSTGASWDQKKLLKYDLPLPDARLSIYFDRMLPRIIALARDSSDRLTKIAACEVLHSIIALFIGSTQHLRNSRDRYATLYGILCEAVLVLGCDPDAIVYGLFHPLALQLMHWLSDESTPMSSVIDSLFNGLTDDSNLALREFSGVCLAEFMRCSIRQMQLKSSTNSHVDNVIEKINSFALHPSTRKRVAAAVAFNHLYETLLEDDYTVSIYWLDIFYSFVYSLNGCNDPSITNALNNIKKVIILKTDLLKETDKNRRKPHEFYDATLTHTLYWLLSQCGSLDEHCRAKCMELYINVSRYNGNHARKTTQDFIEIYGINRLNDIILKGLESNVEDISTIDNMMPLIKALDCYVWLIDENLLPVEKLFSVHDMSEQPIFLCIRKFAYQFWLTVTQPSTGPSMKSRKLEQLQALQCKVLMTTLNFMQVLLNAKIDLPESIWDEPLSTLMIKCVMHPRTIGFDTKNIEMTNKLPCVLETLMKSMKSRYNYVLPNTFKNCFLSSVQKYITKLLDLNEIMQNNYYDDLIQHVNGLILLKKYDMLDQKVLEKSAFLDGENVITQIFVFLVTKRIGESVCRDLNVRMIAYLRALVEFQFSLLSSTNEMIIPDDTRSMTETLINLILKDDLVTNMDFKMIKHGKYFLNMFKSVIFKFMLTHVGVITLVFDILRDHPPFLLKWTENLLLFLKHHRRELQTYVDATINAILQQFSSLRNAVCNVSIRNEILINIYSIVVHLKSNPTEIVQNHEIYQWIRDQFAINNDFEYKIKILKNFFICLTDVTDREDLQISLRSLKTSARSLCSNLSETSHDVNAMKVIDCFETLLVLLSTTKSKIILEFVVHVAASAGKRLLNEKLEEHLCEYYCDMSNEYVLESLQQTYCSFMEINTSEIERLDILREFILPVFKLCSSTVIEQFFKNNINDMHTKIISPTSNDDAINQIIVSKIGCFELMTIMIARVDKDKIMINDTKGNILIGKNFYKILYKTALNIRQLRVMRPECRELMRLLHCSAYNCVLAIISLIKEPNKIITWAFAEQNLIIWQNIIDCDVQYNLNQTIKKYPKTREITVNIKSEETGRNERSQKCNYIHSYDLLTCTLSEDINAYDLNKCVVLPSKFSRSALTDPVCGTTNIALESNDFNKHECMPYICVLLRHITKVYKSIPHDNSPEWLTAFLTAMRHDRNQKQNIQLFMLNIITNTADEVFKSYAKIMLTPIIKTVTDYLKRYDLNYIITDILQILMDWHDTAVPSTTEENKAVQDLFEIFVEKILINKSDNNCVYSYNFGLMRSMIEKWHDCLKVSSEFLKQKMQSTSNTVQLILVLFKNDKMKEIIVKDDVAKSVVNFLLTSLSNKDLPDEDPVPLQCCECLGLYLRALDNSSDNEIEKENKKQELKQKIFDILGSPLVHIKRVYKQMNCISVLCKTYPELARDYINVIISAMSKDVGKLYCLEVFALMMSRLSIQEVVDNLRHMKLQQILTNRVSKCVKITLQIIRDIVMIVSPENLQVYMDPMLLYINDNTTERRELVYDTLMRIYKRYSADITADNAALQNLLSISKQNLLTGLLDPSPDLQERILKFWTQETDLCVESSEDRLIALLNMHSSEMTTKEDVFAPFVILIMLQLASKTLDYTRKMCDAKEICNFEEYEIDKFVSWRRRNLSFRTPMFVDSLASQISYNTFSQSVDSDLYSMSQLRATQDLQSEPTLYNDDNTLHNTEFDPTSVASTSREASQIVRRHKRFPRFLQEEQTSQSRQKEQAEIRKQKIIKQRRNVRLYRKYRIGNFPDVEISHESLIKPLQQLIKLDRLICKDMTVSLFYSLIKEVNEKKKSNFCEIVVKNLKRILHESCETDNSFNAVILETLLQLDRDTIATIADCNSQDIMKASKANHLNALGVLLLERSLLPVESNTLPKRMRLDDDYSRNESTSKWAQLASLYKSLNDVDVVLSIFRERKSFGSDVQEAAFAEANGDWIRARDAFAKAYHETDYQSVKEHCLQGLLESVNNMCDWSEVDKFAKNYSKNTNINDMWNDPWRNWMIPFVCDSYVHMLENEKWSNCNITTIQKWTNDKTKLQYLMPATGENLVLFLLAKDVLKASDLLNDFLDMIGKQLVGLSPLSTELGIRKLFKLQIINDLDASLKVLQCPNEEKDRIMKLLNFWSMKTPTIKDNLVQWNKLAACRTYSSTLFQKIYTKQKIKKRLYRSDYELRSSIVDAALNQKHQHIAEKHLNCVRKTKYLNYLVNEEDISSLKLSIAWLEARVKCLYADIETDEYEKMKKYATSWRSLHELNQRNELDADTSTAIKECIGTMASRIEILSRKNDAFANALAYNAVILPNIGITEQTGNNLDDIREHLLRYSFDNLRSCCENTTTAKIGEHYCALAKHCYSRLMSTDAKNNNIFQEFLLSTLRSMYHDYFEATHYFPCLLRPEQFQDEKVRKIFIQECANLRPWLFLRWRDLLFFHLETPSIATAIIPIVKRLVETYPDAIIYTYHLAVERNPNILQDERIQEIRTLLRDKADKYERFLRAIKHVVQPTLYLKHYLDEAIKDLSQGKTIDIESLLQKIYPDSNATEEDPQQGVIFKKIANHEKLIRDLDLNNRDAALNTLRILSENLRKFNVTKVAKLKDYSPFLNKYIGSGDIEIPGQYSGDKEPISRYHVKIARFESQVEIMPSLRQPIQIGIVGDNGKEYKFLVKFGENLTIDRGLQQLYSTMNRTLRSDPSCRERRLAIDTYEVIPLSSSFGLIQWIDNTKSLENLIKFSASNTKHADIHKKYATWIANAALTNQITELYKVAVLKYDRRIVTEKMKYFISLSKQTALRDTFDAISSSPECFVTLRRNFVVSYATMCIAHWLAGIGDRNLQNTLVCVKTGRCLGIDFGHAFGGGIRSPIPELVPFRLTPQILELLRPFTERDLLATIMSHVMRALREDQGPILACMDIFSHKLLQRSLSVKNEIARNDDKNIHADLAWSSKNIEIITKKLNGIHPSVITLEQLKEAHNDEYFARYSAIVSGNDEIEQERASAEIMRKNWLTPTEQVNCLLDQAKDLNILGRMYVNWQSWL